MKKIVSIVLVFIATSALGFETSKETVFAPPTSGTYQYSPSGDPLTCYFCKDSAGFPAVGQTYVDPVFGQTIRTITDNYPFDTQYRAVQYNRRPYLSANGTYIAAEDPYTNFIFYTANGTLYWDGGADGVASLESSFNPANDDEFFFYAGAVLKKATLSTKTVSSVHTFSYSVSNGGSANIVDNSGRFFVAMNAAGTSATVYDSVDDAEYNAIELSSVDTIEITPGGEGIVCVINTTGAYYRSLNHSTNTIGSESGILTGSSGWHHGLVTDSDGVSWWIGSTQDFTSPEGIAGLRGLWKIKVSDNTQISVLWNETAIDQSNMDINITNSGATGIARDWFAFALKKESSQVQYQSETPWSGWVVGQEEIILCNVKTGDIRRLAHHRMRMSNSSNYMWSPRLSMSPNGDLVVFQSNMGRCYEPIDGDSQITNYVDLYTVNTGLNDTHTLAIGAGSHSIAIGAGSHTITIGQ